MPDGPLGGKPSGFSLPAADQAVLAARRCAACRARWRCLPA